MSLVDDKRAIMGTALGLSATALAALSTNDLLQRYWKMDFGVGHAYDTFESGLAIGSIMDHQTRVKKNKAQEFDVIRGVV